MKSTSLIINELRKSKCSWHWVGNPAPRWQCQDASPEDSPGAKAQAKFTGSMSTDSETSSGRTSDWVSCASFWLSALMRCVRSMIW